jgi:signal transduction histidine kinase
MFHERTPASVREDKTITAYKCRGHAGTRVYEKAAEIRRRMSVTKRAELRSARYSREAALEARIAELEEELQARDDFLAIAAHELRNPMTPIGAQVELLLSKIPEETDGRLTGLLQGLQRLERLVNAYLRRAAVLLEVSRISSGNLRLHIVEVSLSSLVRQVVTNMIPLAERAGCLVRLTVQEGVIGRCDEMAMEQVLENLLSNAVRYGPGKPIEVVFASDGHVTRFSVRDEGIGISERDQAEIFERFHTLPRTKPNGGFGVGLWVTRRLVSAMQGEITVSSNPGVGSTFTVKLPLQSPKADGH